MKCKLTVKDKFLKFFLGKDEFESYEDLLETFKQNVFSKKVYPVRLENGIGFSELEEGQNIEPLLTLYLSGLVTQDSIEKAIHDFLKVYDTYDGRDFVNEDIKFITELGKYYSDLPITKNNALLDQLNNVLKTLESQINTEVPEEEQVAETDEEFLYKTEPSGYAYSVDRVYEIPEGSSLNELVNTREPLPAAHNLDLFRSGMVETIGKNKDKYVLKIERDTLENAQMKEDVEMGFVLVPYEKTSAGLQRVYMDKSSTLDDVKLTRNPGNAKTFGYNNKPGIYFFLPDYNTGKAYWEINEEILPLLQAATDRAHLNEVESKYPDYFNIEYPITDINEELPIVPRSYKGKNRQITLTEFLAGRKEGSLGLQEKTDKDTRSYAGNITFNLDDKKVFTSRLSLNLDITIRVIKLVDHTYKSVEEAKEVTTYLNKLLDFKGGDIFFRTNGVRIQAIPKTKKDETGEFLRLDKTNWKPLSRERLRDQLSFARINVNKEWAVSKAPSTVVGEQFNIVDGKLERDELTYGETRQFYLDHHSTPLRQIKYPNGKTEFRSAKSLMIDLKIASKYKKIEERLEQPTALEEPVVVNQENTVNEQDVLEFLSPERLANMQANSDPEIKEVVDAIVQLLNNEEVRKKLVGKKIRFIKPTTGNKGTYDHSTGIIDIDPSLIYDDKIFTYVFAHELIHAMTVDFIKNNSEDETVKKLTKLAYSLRSTINPYYANPYELIAGLAVPTLAQQFKEIQVDDKSLFETIKDFVKEILDKIFGNTLEQNIYTDLIAKLVDITTRPVGIEGVAESKESKSSKPSKKGRKNFTPKGEKDDLSDIFGFEPQTLDNFLKDENNRTFGKTIVKSLDAELANFLNAKDQFESFINGELGFDTTFDRLRNLLGAESDQYDELDANQEKFFDFVLDDNNYDLVKTLWKKQSEFIKVRKLKDGEALIENSIEVIEPEDDIDPNEVISDENEQESVSTEDLEKRDITGGEDVDNDKYFERTGIETSSIQGADKMSRVFVKMLPKVERDSKGNPVLFSEEQVQEALSNGAKRIDFVQNDRGYLKLQRNSLGRIELCDYYTTWNNIAKYTAGSLSLEEMFKKIDNPKVFRIVPEAYVFMSRLNKPITNTSQAILRSKIETAFKRFDLPVFVVIKDSNDNYLVRDEGADIFGRVKDIINTNLFKNTLNVLKKYVIKEDGQSFFNIKTFIEDQGLNNEDSIRKNKEFLFLLGFNFDLNTERVDVGFGIEDRSEFINFKLNLVSFLKNFERIPFEIGNFITSDQFLDGKKIDGLNNYFKAIYTIENQNRPIASTMMAKNAEGKNQSTLSLPNAILQDTKTINESENVNELKSNLARTKNTIFDYSLSRRILFNKNGERVFNRNLQIINYSGLKSVTDESQSKGATTINLDPADKIKMDFIAMIKEGIFENTRAETASMSLAYRLNWARGGGVQNTPFSWGNLDTLVKGNEFTLDTDSEVFRVWSDYLRGEIEKINEGGKYGLFDFLSDDLKSKLLHHTSVDQNKEQIARELETFFKGEFNDFNTLFETEMGGIESIESDTQIKKIIDVQGVTKMKWFFALNALTMHMEETILFQGDLSRFSKYFKRAKSVQSTGVSQSNSESLIEWINKDLKENSFSTIAGKTLVVGKEFKSALLEDDTQAYSKQSEIEDGFVVSKEEYFKELGKPLTKEELEAESKEKLGKYKANTVSDGDGAIHPDFYKALLYRVGNWPQEREDVYQGLTEDWKKQLGRPYDQKKIDKAVKLMEQGKGIMPKLKVTYRGNISDTTLEGMDKFALFPMFPQFVKDKPLAKQAYDKMLSQDIGYFKFDSGSKINKIGTTDFIKEFENGNLDIGFESSEHTLTSDHLREQIQTPEKAKKENTFGSQFRKLIISSLKNVKGGFIKLANEAVAGDLVKAWEKTVGSLSRAYEENIMKELGLSKVKGHWNFDSLDMNKVVKKLIREVNKRDLPENLKVFFAKFKDEDEAYKYFEQSFSRAEIEKMLTSIIKQISIQKVNGAQLVQVSSSLYNQTGRKLKFYEMKDGVVQPAECKMTMTGDFKNLLNLPEVKERLLSEDANILERTDIINQLLQDDAFVEKYKNVLTLVAYRIPTQGYNSMDVFVIREFLPSYNEMTLIPPPEIVTKSGTDYDYDKESVILPSIDKDGNLISSGIKGHQNNLIDISSKILLDKLNFWRLITPNTDQLIMSRLKGENGLLNKLGLSMAEPKGSNIIKYKTNYLKWLAVKGKNLLGIAAVSNTFYTLMQRHNWKFNDSYVVSLPKDQVHNGTVNPVLLTKEQQEVIKDGSKFNGAYPLNFDGEQKQEIISQLINVTVDMPSDDSFGFSNFKRDNFGTALYLNNVFGVPLDTLFNFFHQPIIYKYMFLVNKYKKTNDLYGKPYSTRKAQLRAIADVLGDNYEVKVFQDDSGEWVEYESLGERTFNKYEQGVLSSFESLEKELNLDKLFVDTTVEQALKINNFSAQQKAVLAHYFKSGQQADILRKANSYLNFDTSIDNVLMKVYDREDIRDELATANLIDMSYIDEVKNDSVVSALNTGTIMKELSKKFFPILYNPINISRFRILGRDVFKSDIKETVYRKATNDFLSSLIQNFGIFKGQKIVDIVRPYVNGDKNLLENIDSIKETLNNEGIQLRLLDILSIDKSRVSNIFNTKLFLGFENSADDKNQLTDEFRLLLNRPDTKKFAQDLAFVGIIQSGYQKSPLYFSDIIPEEFISPVLENTFSQYNNLTEEKKKEYAIIFGAKFTFNEGKLLGLANYKQEAWRLKNYQFELEEKFPVENKPKSENLDLIKQIEMQPDNINKIKSGQKTITNRTYQLEDGKYKLPDKSIVEIKLLGSFKVNNDQKSDLLESKLSVYGENDGLQQAANISTKDEYARAEGFEDWEDFVQNNKFSKNFVNGNENRFVYSISLENNPVVPTVNNDVVPPTQIAKPENLWSGSNSSFAAALTNPTSIAKRKGKIKSDYPVSFNGKTYVDAEAAYKANKINDDIIAKQGKIDPKNNVIMVQIITAKLNQYPELVEELTNRGGVKWLEQSEHTVNGNRFEGKGLKSPFIVNLIEAYKNVLSPIVKVVDSDKQANKEAFDTVMERKGNPETVNDHIAEFFSNGGKISPNSFTTNLDRNYLGEKLYFIKKGGRSIDDLAISLSNASKMDITDFDIVEFIRDYNSSNDYWNQIQEKIKNDLLSYWNQDQSEEECLPF